MARHNKTYCSIDVEVDVSFDAVLPEIPTDILAEELRDRKVEVERRAREQNRCDEKKEAVRAAIKQIHRGDTMDAVTTLEREFFPKWKSAEESKEAYEKARRKRGGGWVMYKIIGKDNLGRDSVADTLVAESIGNEHHGKKMVEASTKVRTITLYDTTCWFLLSKNFGAVWRNLFSGPNPKTKTRHRCRDLQSL